LLLALSCVCLRSVHELFLSLAFADCTAGGCVVTTFSFLDTICVQHNLEKNIVVRTRTLI
jgi:hypothetical protein